MEYPITQSPEIEAPPTLPAEQDAAEKRQSTWLEHFYDLIFVVAIGTLILRASEHYSPFGLLQVGFLTLVIWWAWIGHTVYDTRFDPDDFPHRVATFIMMLGAAGLAIHVPTAFEEGARNFAFSYIVARLMLIALYLRSFLMYPELRQLSGQYLAGFGAGTLFWIGSLFLPWGFWLWYVGISLELFVPRLIRIRLGRVPVDPMHLPERFGIFTMISIGAAIISVLTAVSWANLDQNSLAAAFFGFVLTVCFWFTYFAMIDIEELKEKIGTAEPFIYLHFPIFLGLVLFSIGIEQAIMKSDDESLVGITSLLLGLGNALWLTALLVTRWFTLQSSVDAGCLLRYGLAIAACIAFIVLAPMTAPVAALALFTGAMCLFTSFDVRSWNMETPRQGF